MLDVIALKVQGLLKVLHLYSAWLFVREYMKARKMLVCAQHYTACIRTIRARSSQDKIRVLFIVSEISKWKEQRLYEEMERSGVFYPIVGLSAWNRQLEHLCPNDRLLDVHTRAESFFDKLGDRHVRTVTIENGVRVFHDLREFAPDVVYYTEHWVPCEKQGPMEVSKFALVCYTPYYTPNYGVFEWDCQLDLHRMLYAYFCLNQAWCDLYSGSLKWLPHCVQFIPAGHPALDFFMGSENDVPATGKIIYAPHFSFYNPKCPNSTERYSTFDQNYREILAYAKAHTEFKWVFKPHPLLREWVMSSGLMTDEELDAYFAEWANIGTVCEDGDYQQLFLDSRAMITDCGSFLTEYGSTGRPVIHLICSANRHVPTNLIKNLYDTYYQVHNLEEMYKTFKLVLEDRQDPNREMRIAEAKKSGILGSNASKAIVDYLIRLLRPCEC